MPYVAHPPVSLDELKTRYFAEVWEVADVFRCDRRSVREACRRGCDACAGNGSEHTGEYPHVLVGNEFRIPTAWLLAQAMAGAR